MLIPTVYWAAGVRTAPLLIWLALVTLHTRVAEPSAALSSTKRVLLVPSTAACSNTEPAEYGSTPDCPRLKLMMSDSAETVPCWVLALLMT